MREQRGTGRAVPAKTPGAGKEQRTLLIALNRRLSLGAYGSGDALAAPPCAASTVEAHSPDSHA
jgi:hypothetical protein